MFRTARISFTTTGFGGESRTDIFRVLVNDDRQDAEVHAAVHAGGFRSFRIRSWAFTD
mgnify:FL=1